MPKPTKRPTQAWDEIYIRYHGVDITVCADGVRIGEYWWPISRHSPEAPMPAYVLKEAASQLFTDIRCYQSQSRLHGLLINLWNFITLP